MNSKLTRNDMPTKYSASWTNAAMWAMMVQLEEQPNRLSLLPREPGKRRMATKTATRLVEAGYVFGDMGSPDPWLMLTQAGRAEMARIRALPRLPLYAGGEKPYYARKPRVTVEQLPPEPTFIPALRLPAPEAPQLPPAAPTQAAGCTVSITATLEVSVDMALEDFRDAQSVASAVARKLLATDTALNAALRGWVINGVMQGDAVITAERRG